jgi:hypothetical protein
VLRDAPLDDAALYYSSPEFDPEAERLNEEAVFADIANAEQRLAEVTSTARARDWPLAPTPHPTPRAPNPMQEMLQAARDPQRRTPDPTFPPPK